MKIKWRDAFAAELELSPLTAEHIAECLDVEPEEVFAAARALPGTYRNPATGSLCLRPHERRQKCGLLLNDLACLGREPWAHWRVILLRRWAAGNFAVPRELSRILKR